MSSSIVLENSQGKFLFQLRDNKKSIPYRNQWSFFGGGIEKGETPLKTIVREIKEELNLKLDKNKIKLLFKRDSKSKKNFVFYYNLGKKSSFKLGEGQKYEFFTRRQILLKRNVVPAVRLFMFLYTFFKKKNL